jgi:hypothetical protein
VFQDQIRLRRIWEQEEERKEKEKEKGKWMAEAYFYLVLQLLRHSTRFTVGITQFVAKREIYDVKY